MPERGYVYALINPTLAGMVKVGKTTKDPNERAKELSSATGVPTPFLVAYQIYVADCCNAEKCVHTYLEESGYRVSGNREFFNAPLNIVIEALLNVQNQLQTATQKNLNDDYDEAENLSDQLYQQAVNYLDGAGDTLQNYDKALAYFKKSARLGSADAHWQLGRMYEIGDGCIQDITTSLDYYEKAALLGNYFCYAIMGGIYSFTGLAYNIQHISNARKCYNKFFESEMYSNKNMSQINSIHAANYIYNVYKVNEMIKWGRMLDESQIPMPLEHLEKINELKEEIFNFVQSHIDSWKSKNDSIAISWSIVLDYAKNSLR